MRIAICDYSGHPFQVQLSRELARRGHAVLHLHFAEFQTPKGRLSIQPDDPPTLEIAAVSLGRPFAKYSFLRRRWQEIEVGRRIAARIEAFAPDVVIGSNLPIDALLRVAKACWKADRPFVFWQQDIYSAAIGRILARKIGFLGALIGAYYRRLEAKVVRRSSAVVVISADFVPVLARDLGVGVEHVHVIQNWAPLDEIVPGEKSNPWSVRFGLDRKKVVLYSGTLGLKHDPSQFIQLAAVLKSHPDTIVVVISEGSMADWIAAEARSQGLANLRVLPFQPFDSYSQVLASADVLVATLEPDAGVFSVPSKVLSYLSAGRPIILSAPPQNLASQVLAASGGGKVVANADRAALAEGVLYYLTNPELRQDAGRKARAYAETAFDIRTIGDRFEAIVRRAVAARNGSMSGADAA